MDFGILVRFLSSTVLPSAVAVCFRGRRWFGQAFEPAFQHHDWGDDEFGEGDVFAPAGEEFGEEKLHLACDAVLVGSCAEVGFWGAETGGEG